jgi:hypothetical protein
MEPMTLVSPSEDVLTEWKEGVITEWKEGVITEWKNSALHVRLLESDVSNSQFGPVVALWTVWTEVRNQLRARSSKFVVDVSALHDLSIGLAVLLSMISREMDQAGGTLKVVGRAPSSKAGARTSRPSMLTH